MLYSFHALLPIRSQQNLSANYEPMSREDSDGTCHTLLLIHKGQVRSEYESPIVHIRFAFASLVHSGEYESKGNHK